MKSALEAAAPPSAPESGSETPRAGDRGGVSFRAVLIGLLLIPVTVYWITLTEVRWYTLDGTSLPLFIQPVFFLFLLCLVNLVVSRVRRRPLFQQGELLVIYIMTALACSFAGHDLLRLSPRQRRDCDGHADDPRRL